VPWIGGVLAVVTVASAIRRKGVLGGVADTVLDFIPFIGAVKSVAEARRGRDYIPDRAARAARSR